MAFKKILLGFVMLMIIISSTFAYDDFQETDKLAVEPGVKPYNSLWYADMLYDRIKIATARVLNKDEAYHTVLEVQEERTAELIDVTAEVRLRFLDRIIAERQEFANLTIQYANEIEDLEKRQQAFEEINKVLEREDTVLKVTAQVFRNQKEQRVRISNAPREIPTQSQEGGVPTDEQLDEIINSIEGALSNNKNVEDEKVDEILNNIADKLEQASQNQGQSQSNNPNNQGGNN